MAAQAMTYKVVVERDESGHWIARVPHVRGCHTFARNLPAVPRRIREALSLWVDDADSADLDVDVRLPAPLRDAVRRGRSARERAEQVKRVAKDEVASSVQVLEEAGLSRRDAAELLGVSHQRVQQIADVPSTTSERDDC
jgi:predicted RNase H-like HicB family nuclease